MAICAPNRSVRLAMRSVLLLIIVSGSCWLFIFDRQNSLEAQIEDMIAQVLSVREQQTKLQLTHERIVMDVNKTISNNQALQDQIEVLEQSSKRYNLRFLGIPEEIPDDPLTLVKTVIKEKMGVQINDEIDAAFRISEGFKPRPILVKFTKWKYRTRIFYRRKSLALPIKVEEDLTEQQKLGLEKLKKFAEKAERNGQKVRWNGRQLFVDGELIKL